jgi:hypothetical protein
MRFFIESLVTYRGKIGIVDEVYDDVYLVTFLNEGFRPRKDDYGYFLEDELDFELAVLVKRIMGKAKERK